MDAKSVTDSPAADARPLRRTLIEADRGVHLNQDPDGTWTPDRDDLQAAASIPLPAIASASR